MLDELKFRYRALSLSVRMLLVSVIGIIPGALNYFDEAPILETELEAAKSAEAAERQKLATANEQVKNLPAMEEKKAFTTDQLKRAEKVLPVNVLVDHIVEQVGKGAKDSNVQVRYFAPSGETTITGEYPYDEVRFKMALTGKFQALAKWLDSIGGVESRGYIKSWDISPYNSEGQESKSHSPVASSIRGPENNSNTDETAKKTKLSELEKAQKSRDDLKLNLNAEVAFYRTATFIAAKSPNGALVPPKLGEPAKPATNGGAPTPSPGTATPQSMPMPPTSLPPPNTQQPAHARAERPDMKGEAL